MYLSLDEFFASLSVVSQVLEKYEDEFFKVVDAKINLLRLKRKKVITEGLISKIENADGENAKEILFDHLKSNADVANLREYCYMVIAADAYPKMQELGTKMLSELPPEGLLECCVVLRVCVYVCVHTGVNTCPVLGVQAGVLLCYVVACMSIYGRQCGLCVVVCLYMCVLGVALCSTSSPVCVFPY